MPGYDGSIVFETALDSKQLEKDLNNLNRKIATIEGNIHSKRMQKTQLESQLKKLQKPLDEAKGKISSLRQEEAKLQEVMSGGFNTSFEDFTTASVRLEKLPTEIKEAENVVRDLQKEFDGVYHKVETLDIGIQKDTRSLEQANEQAEAIKSKLGGKNLLSGLRKAASGLLATLGKVAKTISGKAWKSLKTMFSGSGKSGKGILGDMGKFLSYSFGIRTLYTLFSKLRSAMSEGMKNLANFSTGANASISSMKSALAQLKNSFATAFVPILTVVAPIITSFINMLSSAVTAVARLSAMLSGQSSFIKATKVQESYADSLGGTADAAKEAKRQLAGFDEINRLEGKDSSGGGGGGGNAGQTFEEVPVEPLNFDSWGQALDSAISYILNNGIPKLEEGLSQFAGWVNVFSTNVAEMFSFPGIDEKVSQLGTKVSSALNSFVEQIDWNTIGTAIGSGLNFALQFLTAAVYGFDWITLGGSLAEAFNGLINTVDWYAMGEWLWSRFNIAIETLVGFLLNLDMEQLALAAGNIVEGFFDSMSKTIQGTDWKGLGEQVRKFLVSIDWPGVAHSVFTAIGGAFGATAAFLWGLIEEAWNSVIESWLDASERCGGDVVAGLLLGILEGLIGIATWIYDHVFKPIWDGFCDAFGIHSPSTVMKDGGIFLVKGLLNGISSVWSSITGFLGGALDGIKKKFSDAWTSIRSVTTSIWNGIANAIKGAVNGIISGVNGMISGVVSGINSVARAINRMSFTIPDWVPGFGGKRFGFNIPQISAPQIPYLAQGAVIPPNREFLAVLGDQRHGTNIEAPLETIQEAVALVMNDFIDSNMAGHEATVGVLREILAAVLGIEIGDEVIAQAVNRYNRKMAVVNGGGV